MAVYPIRAVSQLTGLGLDTLRAWERRYQAVSPARGQRGRVYGNEEIQRLRLLRGAVEAGHAIGQIAALTNAELEPLQASSTGRVLAHTNRVQDLLSIVAAYDGHALEAELGRLATLLKPADLIHDIILPLMKASGERWEQGSLRIGQEHLLSGCVRSLLGAMIRRQGPGMAGKIVFATPPGELHEFGILAAAMLAVAHHFEAIYLGPNLPSDEVLAAARAITPRAVVVGLMRPAVTPALRLAIEQISRGLDTGVELWVGGPGAHAAVNAAWNNTVIPTDLREFERHLARLRG
jgi:DNA-binding transcriptional MerR regulator